MANQVLPVREVETPVHIHGHLYMGRPNLIRQVFSLRRANVTHILYLANLDVLPPHVIQHFQALTIQNFDDLNMMTHFRQCFNFIHEARDNGGRVLIFCSASGARSCAIVIAFLMTFENLGLENAANLVQQRLHEAQFDGTGPNDQHRASLTAYDALLAQIGAALDLAEAAALAALDLDESPESQAEAIAALAEAEAALVEAEAALAEAEAALP